MATKWIIIIVLAILWIVYVVFFNPEDRDGYLRGIGQLFRFLVSIVVLLILSLATVLIF